MNTRQRAQLPCKTCRFWRAGLVVVATVLIATWLLG